MKSLTNISVNFQSAKLKSNDAMKMRLVNGEDPLDVDLAISMESEDGRLHCMNIIWKRKNNVPFEVMMFNIST